MHVIPAYSLLPEGADTEAAEAVQPTQAAEAARTQAAEAALSTEAAEAAQSEAAAAAAEAAVEAAAYGLDLSGSANFSASLPSFDRWCSLPTATACVRLNWWTSVGSRSSCVTSHVAWPAGCARLETYRRATRCLVEGRRRGDA